MLSNRITHGIQVFGDDWSVTLVHARSGDGRSSGVLTSINDRGVWENFRAWNMSRQEFRQFLSNSIRLSVYLGVNIDASSIVLQYWDGLVVKGSESKFDALGESLSKAQERQTEPSGAVEEE